MNARETMIAAALGKGCLGRAAPDEPVFVLRAQDALAADLVTLWADKAHAAGTPDSKVTGALEVAEAMRAWARRKVTD